MTQAKLVKFRIKTKVNAGADEGRYFSKPSVLITSVRKIHFTQLEGCIWSTVLPFAVILDEEAGILIQH